MASGAVKVQVGVLMAVVVMMVATSVVTPVDARLDFSQILDSFDSYVSRENNGACCDNCICTRSFPPQCRCLDIKETCYEGCKGCLCTRSFPPQCRCTDIIQGFCYKPCTSTTTDN